MQKTTNESEEVNLQLFKDSIDKNMNIDNNLYRIELWGGEPSLYKKEIVELIEYFREKVSKELKLEIFISTNGTLLEDISFIENLYTYRNLDIGFGISHDGELQLENRGKTIKDIVFENLKKIAIIEESNKNNTKISYSFNLTLTNNNYNIINIFKYFNELFNKYNLKSRAINFQIIKGTDSDSKKYRILKYDFQNMQGLIFGINTTNEDKIKIFEIIQKKCQNINEKILSFFKLFIVILIKIYNLKSLELV
jgi:sulfatase maturation enzyme AslB (radical SAM superfamily)